MNQKDYKVIAEILRPFVLDVNLQRRELQICASEIARQLADYFEKESALCKDCITLCPYCGQNKHACGCGGRCATNKDIDHLDALKLSFNRSEFLKDCGVEE